MSILPLLLSLLAVNTVSCTEGVSRLELLKMVQKLTGRVEQLEEGRNLTDEVGKLGEAMTGAVEKLGDKTEKLGEAMTGAVEKLGEKLTQGLGEAMTGAVEKLGEKLTQGLGEAMTGAVEKLGEKLTQGLGEAMTGAVEKLGDKTEKLGEAMTGAVEKLGEKLTQGLGEAMTGAVEKLGDKTEKLGEAMTGAVEKLGDKTEKLGEAMTGAVEKLGDKTEKLGEAMTGAVKKLGDKTEKLGEAMTEAMEKLGDKTETLGESLTNAIQHPYTPSSCYDVMPLDVTDNVHALKVNDRYIRVFCDQHTAGGGWTVIQRRQDGSVDFNRNWTEYRQGFGDIQGNFWLGLDNIHLLTTARNQTLRVDLQDFDNNTAYAEYRFFAIDGPDSFYRLHLDGYTGTAGDSLTYHNNLPFSTHDSDHDSHSSLNCAEYWRGAWWYVMCGISNLNGPYLTSAQHTDKSINWYYWKNARIALKHVEMKIRPAV